MYNFEKLTVWKESLALSKLCYELTRKLPKYEINALSDQLRRSVTSIMLNIAEGSGSENNREFLRYLYISRKSLYETVSLLKFIESEYQEVDLKEALDKIELVGKLLNGLIKKLKNQKLITNN